MLDALYAEYLMYVLAMARTIHSIVCHTQEPAIVSCSTHMHPYKRVNADLSLARSGLIFTIRTLADSSSPPVQNSRQLKEESTKNIHTLPRPIHLILFGKRPINFLFDLAKDYSFGWMGMREFILNAVHFWLFYITHIHIRAHNK